MPMISQQARGTDVIPALKPTTVTIEHISKRFKGASVLEDISLDIKAGELVALLGPSGSGKTTLLRIIAGLENPDGGRVEFGGMDATGLSVQKRKVGFVFQHYALFKHLTIAGNVAYGLRARPRAERPSKSDINSRVEALLDLIKLSNFADRYPSQLSGGQRQRVALARALAVEPRVLLLDEPFGALDAQLRKDLRRWLRDIHIRTGQTTIFVTHDQDEALELSDRVAILHGGRLEQVGTPNEVQEHPASIPVLKFLGDSFELETHSVDGQAFIGGSKVPVATPAVKDGPGRLFVRPWQFELVAPEAGHIQANVKSGYRSQGLSHLSVASDSGQIFTVDTAQPVSCEENERIGLQITGGHSFPA
jgi:sulfate transport system ATP-binding protein